MTLQQLKETVDNAIVMAAEYGSETPDEILVTLQMDVDGKDIWSHKEVELHYDNNGFASGCVLTAYDAEYDDGPPFKQNAEGQSLRPMSADKT